MRDVSIYYEALGKILSLLKAQKPALRCRSPRTGQRSAFNRLSMAIVQGQKQAGNIRLDASSPGLEGAVVVIEAEPAKLRPAAI